METMHCWPTDWINAAKKADLAFGVNNDTGQFFVRGGPAAREALAIFATEILAASNKGIGGELTQIQRKAACFDELLAALALQDGWNNADDWAVEKIHEAYCAQEEIQSAHQFAAQYISDAIKSAINRAKKAIS